MATFSCKYWPFAVPPRDARTPEETEEIAFLDEAHKEGWKSFRCGISDFGAGSKEREGIILERGRKRWEIRLSETKRRRLVAYVDDFRSAGEAVREWLRGSSVKEIVESVSKHLVTPPGAKASHYIIDDDCPT